MMFGAHGGAVGNLVPRHSPTFDKAVLALKGQLMTTEELRALKHELRQLSLELNSVSLKLVLQIIPFLLGIKFFLDLG